MMAVGGTVTEPAGAPAAALESPTTTPRPADTVRAAVMFVLAFVYLLVVAGLVHRANTPTVAEVELHLIYGCLAGLWPVFAAEVLWGLWRRDRSQPLRPVLLRTLLVLLIPPWRMGWIDPRFGQMWVPRIGWSPPGRNLFKRLERAFAVPMVLFAFLILPVLLVEYLKAEQVKENAALALALDIGIAVIWIAFATEFILKASAHPRPLQFAKDCWLDAAIVILPMLEFLLTKWVDAAPLARLVRLGRALSPEQLARMKQLYRLRGLATKAFHALLLIEGVGRLLGQTPEKRLARIQQRIEELQAEIAELEQEAEEWRARIRQTQTDTASGTADVPLICGDTPDGLVGSPAGQSGSAGAAGGAATADNAGRDVASEASSSAGR